MPTARTFTYKNPGSQLGYSERMVNLGDTNIFVAPQGTNADPLDADAWYLMGIVTGEATINPNLEKYEVVTGSPQSRKAVIKTSQMDSVTLTVSHLTLLGYQFAYASELRPTGTATSGIEGIGFTFAADGQTTVSSTTDAFTTTVADATDIAPGDVCLVQNSANGSQYFDELAYIELKSGNVLTHNVLSQQPLASTPFLKLAGPAAAQPSGIKFASGGCAYPRLEFLIVRYLHNGRYMFIQHRPEGQVTGSDGFVFSPTEPATVNMTIDFIDQGSDNAGPIYGNDYFIPQES